MRELFVSVCGGRVRIEFLYVPGAIRSETLPAFLLDTPEPYCAAPDTGRLPTFSLP